jgi:hypothetical protein
MRRRSRIWIGLLVSIAAPVAICFWVIHTFDANRKLAVQHKSVQHASGTIVSVTEQPHDEQSYDLLPGPRVCFTIDSFAEIPGAERSVYESAERIRQAAHGPRCLETSIDPSAVRIKAGDPVDVYFTLENAGQISIVRISTNDVDL